jgi:hypothetical protein
LTSSFLICIPFISFSCLIVWAKTPSTIVNKSGDCGYPHLIPDFRGNAFSFSSFTIILAKSLCFMLWQELLFWVSSGLLSWRDAELCWRFWYTILSLLICTCWTFLAFLEWSQLDHAVWSLWCVAEFALQEFCWGFLYFCSSRKLAYSFLFLVVVLVSWSSFGITVTLAK